MLALVFRQFLPLGLGLAAVLGLLAPAPGRYMAALPTQQVAVAVIFVCAGLRLRTDEVWAALACWPAAVFGLASTLLFTPVIGALLAFRMPLDPAFCLGLALFCCMPTTLSSGIALTGQARGSVALALLLTVLTNFVGVFTVPFVLALLLNTVGHVELSALDLLLKLCATILLPLLVGGVLRRFVAGWARRHDEAIGVASNAALILVPWTQFSQSSERLAAVGWAGMGLVVVAGLSIHTVFLLLNESASRLLRFPLAVRRAVVLLASQKTLPVAITVLAFLPVPAATKGLVAIPCVTTHLGQIFMDAMLATRWRRTAQAQSEPNPG